MLCSISGTVPEDPVVSKKSGLLFEKRLIEKVVEDTGRCPITDEVLEKDDLLPLKSKAVNPRTLPATSIPGLLSLFQNEWDATMLEMHQLRHALQSSRQELSHALYQHDAATRVIARLLRERDGYRTQLESVQRGAAALPAAVGANGKRAAESEAGSDEQAGKKAKSGLTSAVTDAMTAKSNELSKTRKKRVISPSIATPEVIASYSALSSQPLHQTTKGGILAIDLAPGAESVVATAGVDCSVKVFDSAAGQVVANLKGHSKKVNDVKFIGSRDLLASGSSDHTVKLWRAPSSGAPHEAAAVLSAQDGEIVSLCVHPTNDYLVTASTDGTWAYYDVNQAECLTKVNASEENIALSAAALHPDGLILATGDAQAGIRIWESRTQKSVAQFSGHTGAITSLSFSENGYHMASAAADGVKLWDLRKLKNFQSLTPYEKSATSVVKFDHSGLFLGVGGADARVYGVKQDWSVVATFTDVPKKGVYSLAFGTDAQSLFVGGGDHKLRIFGSSQ